MTPQKQAEKTKSPSAEAVTVPTELASSVSAETEERKLFTVTSWRGLPKHNCKLCAWDTLNGEAAIVDHLTKAHFTQQAEAKILVARR